LCGAVANVKECKLVKGSNGAPKTIRAITLTNQECHPLVISLWEDLAKKEGSILQNMIKDKPIVAITKITARKYNEEWQWQSSSASILIIQPTFKEAKLLKKMVFQDA
ncbi:replication protein A 70 kDa DNA-binding subunit A, partial [Striga asiatica]